jgi:hypothetical protein
MLFEYELLIVKNASISHSKAVRYPIDTPRALGVSLGQASTLSEIL